MKKFLRIFLCSISVVGVISLSLANALVSNDTAIQLRVTSPGKQDSCPDPLSRQFLISAVSGVTCGLVFSACAGFLWKISKTRKKKNLDDKRDRLQRESRQAKDDADALSVNLTQLNELRSGLEGQFLEGFRSQLKVLEKERERNEERVKEVEVKIEDSERENATDRTERYLREQQSLLDDQGELEKRKNELEEKKLQTEKLLQKADKMIELMGERHKSKMNLIDFINMQLEGGVDENTYLHPR